MSSREHLLAAFRARYGVAPDALVHAPGRVNLMGDHIDYLQLPVLPMALQLGITAAVRRRADAEVRVANVNPTYAPAAFTAAASIPPEPGTWHDYVRAGVATVAGELPGVPCGFDLLVTSDLPVASGLSSSSALVVAAALAAVYANDLPLDRLRLAEAVAHGERYVGTEGGGMDQAVSLCGEPGCVLRIDFAPLRVRPMPVPRDWRVVVASSLRFSEKSGTVRAAYNERSRAARSALARVAGGLTGDALLEWIEAHHTDGARAAERNPRVRHVLHEALRVVAATSALRAADAARFGQLMTASHRSLRDDYQVSTPELDALVEIALQAGALGARLTGAGFGGSAIALCTVGTEAVVRRELHRRFYAPRSAAPGQAFVAEPSGGASITPL